MCAYCLLLSCDLTIFTIVTAQTVACTWYESIKETEEHVQKYSDFMDCKLIQVFVALPYSSLWHLKPWHADRKSNANKVK